jgi:hypothetical protein
LASEPMKTQDASVATKIVTDQIPVTSSTLVIDDRTVSRMKLVILRGEISRVIYGIFCNSCLRDSVEVSEMSPRFWYEVQGLPEDLSDGLIRLLELLYRDMRRSAE